MWTNWGDSLKPRHSQNKLFRCEETGHNGMNEIDVPGNNFWIEQIDGGSNQTYLLLNVIFNNRMVKNI